MTALTPFDYSGRQVRTVQVAYSPDAVREAVAQAGWDCRSDGQWKWAATREEAIANGLGKSERAALGLSLPGESDEGGAA